MDVNGLRAWQVADAAGFGLSGTPPAGLAQDLFWRADARLLRLDSQQDAPTVAEDQAYARAQALKPSPVADPGGSYAWWDGAAGLIRAAGFGAGATPIGLAADVPPGVAQPTDLAFGTDDILYVARNDGVVMTDRRDRFADARIDLAGFRAQRLCPAPGGGVWALDRVDGSLARLSGRPLRRASYAAPAPDAFYPQEPNPRPPRLRLVRGARLPAGGEGIALAGSPAGQVAVLAWVAGAEAELFTLRDRRLVRRFALDALRFPYGLAWVGEDRVAVLASDGAKPAVQAFVYELAAPPSETARARPLGAFHPLIAAWDGGFVNALAAVPSYPVFSERRDTPAGLRQLRPLSGARYARSGRTTLGPFDAGAPGNIWHRLQVEAAVPDHSGLRVWAHADDQGGVPGPPGGAGAPEWSPHVIGAAAGLADQPDAPRGAWADSPSELPFNPGLLPCPGVPGRSGRFTLLLQRAGRRVRRLEGRYLWLHLELLGDSQATPELAGLRVYGGRFSYRDRYLPALYHETLAGPDAAAAGAATPPDFLERFLSLFEGPLTELEDKVAGAWLLTDPAAAPEAALPWLAAWIGLTGDAGAASDRLRQHLRAAPWTARLHGTLGGLLAALELETGGRVVTGGSIGSGAAPRPGTLALASLPEGQTRVLVLGVSGASGGSTVLSGGAVTRGEIVVLEGFRLRRTFGTILGADLAAEDDPLTGSFAQSGNSMVGDTLTLGDTALGAVAALFAPGPAAGDGAAVAAFFERLAYRVLVLVRPGDRTADIARLARAAAAAAPAHVEVTLLPADRPLIVAASSLVGLDTFLTPPAPVQSVRVGRSRAGTGDQVQGSGRLDDRADGPGTPRPVAMADGPSRIRSGTGFVLSALRSEAAPGRTIAQHIWTWL